MKTYSQLSEEITAQDADKLSAQIADSFSKHFPNGYVSSSAGKSIGSMVISVSIGMIKDINDVSNKIRMNDPMSHKFLIHIEGDKYEAVGLQGGLSIEPEEGSYMAMGRVKTPWRKTLGDSTKVLKAFETFFTRLTKIVKDNEDNVYGRSRINDKYFKVK